MSKRILPETKEKILHMRMAGYPQKIIAQQTGTSLSTVTRLLRERKGEKRCPKCKEALPINARYCFVCGTKILTRREQVAEDLAHIADLYKFLPETARDEFIRAIRAAISMLKEETHE